MQLFGGTLGVAQPRSTALDELCSAPVRCDGGHTRKVGAEVLYHFLRDLVTRQTDISSIRSALLAPDAPVSSLIHNFAFQLEIGNGPQGT